MQKSTTKSERLVARATPEEKALIARAAAMRGRSITDFMVDAAQRAARSVVAEESIIHLSVENQQRLAAALLDPPAPNAALTGAARAYDEADITSR